MREYREAMRRRGLSRSVNPLQLAGRRVWEELAAGFRLFPSSLLLGSDQMETVNLPRRFRAPEQESLFDPGVILLPDGSTADLGTYSRVRYAVMLQTIGFEPPFYIPVDPDTAGRLVEAFEAEVGRFREDARECASQHVAAGNVADAVEEAERLWFRAARDAGMTPPGYGQEAVAR
jgi:hypothetical protein